MSPDDDELSPRGRARDKGPADRTSRRLFLVAGALLVAGAAVALGLSRCDQGPEAPERPDPIPGSAPSGPTAPGR
jgi:hypothetical protein